VGRCRPLRKLELLELDALHEFRPFFSPFPSLAFENFHHSLNFSGVRLSIKRVFSALGNTVLLGDEKRMPDFQINLRVEQIVGDLVNAPTHRLLDSHEINTPTEFRVVAEELLIYPILLVATTVALRFVSFPNGPFPVEICVDSHFSQ
jgi:hypothetical protein